MPNGALISRDGWNFPASFRQDHRVSGSASLPLGLAYATGQTGRGTGQGDRNRSNSSRKPQAPGGVWREMGVEILARFVKFLKRLIASAL